MIKSKHMVPILSLQKHFSIVIEWQKKRPQCSLQENKSSFFPEYAVL